MDLRAIGRTLILCLVSALAGCRGAAPPSTSTPPSAATGRSAHLGPAAWTGEQWRAYSRGVRTSYNPHGDLSDSTLTLGPGDPRWLDFVFWAIDNKVGEHQVEAYGGTGWNGPKGGVIFHWAPGSHWEQDRLASFGMAIGHVSGEHRWTDAVFPDFFEKYGGVFGINIKDRLAEISPDSPDAWAAFLDYCGGANSPYYRYIFHQEAVVDAPRRRIHFIAGQGIAFTYSFERYQHELREVLTDARAVDFFRMYDLFGPGFASEGNWAHQNSPAEALARIGYLNESGPSPDTAGVMTAGMAAEMDRPPAPVPAGLPESDALERGRKVYAAQCTMCHGPKGDGHGFMAASFEVAPRDFTPGNYFFRSTATGELPRIEDIERTVRRGVPRSTMPAWGQFLSAAEIHDVSRYLVVFSDRFVEAWKAGEEPARLAVSAPPRDLAALAARGAALYPRLQCAKCHGPAGRGDGPAAATLRDQWREPAHPTDLTGKWTFRNGHAPEDVYRSIIGGLNGTPMPSYESVLQDEGDRWAVVAYTLSLAPAERPVIHLANFAAERKTRLGPDGRVMPAEGGSGTGE